MHEEKTEKVPSGKIVTYLSMLHKGIGDLLQWAVPAYTREADGVYAVWPISQGEANRLGQATADFINSRPKSEGKAIKEFVGKHAPLIALGEQVASIYGPRVQAVLESQAAQRETVANPGPGKPRGTLIDAVARFTPGTGGPAPSGAENPHAPPPSGVVGSTVDVGTGAGYGGVSFDEIADERAKHGLGNGANLR